MTTTGSLGLLLTPVGTFSIFLITSNPSITRPNTTCFPSRKSHLAHVFWTGQWVMDSALLTVYVTKYLQYRKLQRYKQRRSRYCALVNAVLYSGPNHFRWSAILCFFVTCAKCDFLDGKHVVFGRVIDGLLVMRKIENVPTGVNNKPKLPVVVTQCGEM